MEKWMEKNNILFLFKKERLNSYIAEVIVNMAYYREKFFYEKDSSHTIDQNDYIRFDLPITTRDMYTNVGYHSVEEQRCFICKMNRFKSNHLEENCPMKCPCGKYHSAENHWCFICDLNGFKHIEKDCPMRCSCGGYHRLEDCKMRQPAIPFGPYRLKGIGIADVTPKALNDETWNMGWDQARFGNI